MGQVCSGEAEERPKAGAFEGSPEEGLVFEESAETSSAHVPQEQAPPQLPQTPDVERLQAEREEQARLDLIVSAAGRGMVSVRSTRGSTGYYDQGFAAALAQHLEQTTKFPSQLEIRLPPPSTTSTVYDQLIRPSWEGIALGNAGGPAGCGGEHPARYMDHLAESLLDSVVPAKQRLFAGASPMVENLL